MAMTLMDGRTSEDELILSWRLPAQPWVLSFVRDQVAGGLKAHGFGSISDEVVLVAVELCTNAINNPKIDLFRLEVYNPRHTLAVAIAVWDPDGEYEPQRQTPADVDEASRGLLIVEALSEMWVTYPSEQGGKTVFALISKPYEDD